jgi:hypothetical protein
LLAVRLGVQHFVAGGQGYTQGNSQAGYFNYIVFH